MAYFNTGMQNLPVGTATDYEIHQSGLRVGIRSRDKRRPPPPDPKF
jgi:hypothetical protein